MLKCRAIITEVKGKTGLRGLRPQTLHSYVLFRKSQIDLGTDQIPTSSFAKRQLKILHCMQNIFRFTDNLLRCN